MTQPRIQSRSPTAWLGDANLETTDLVYLVYGADRFVEYKRVAADSEIFRGVNGAAGVIEHQPDATGEPDLYVLTDPRGVQYTFFGDDGDAGPAEGQLWKIVDPDDNTIYAGDATTASTAITNGFTGGRFEYVYDSYADAGNSDGRRYTFSYDGNDRLTEVKAENKTGGTWSSPCVAIMGERRRSRRSPTFTTTAQPATVRPGTRSLPRSRST